MYWGVNDVMPGSDGLGILVIFEKSRELRFEPGRGQSSALVGVSCSWSLSCSSRQWEPAPSRGLGTSGPSVEQPSRMRKKCC